MPPTPDDPLQSPQEITTPDSPLPQAPKRLFGKSPLASISGSLQYRRSNTSLSSIFASTSALPTALNNGSSPNDSGANTPTTGVIGGSVFSPGGSTAIPSPSSGVSPQVGGPNVGGGAGLKDVIVRAFSPYISVLASGDTEELIRHKGIHGGLLELLRPFGEQVAGKVTVRDSSGSSRSWEDFGVRFVGARDGLEGPRVVGGRESTESARGLQAVADGAKRAGLAEYKPARLRTGGDVPQIEELVERHLTFAEESSGPVEVDYINFPDTRPSDPNEVSPFYSLYLRRMLSGLPLVPSETLAHPVAAIIAISSRSASPIEELRSLYDSSNTGENRLPAWVHNEFLRYYVLIHDEDYDDITKSMQLYDQMKRHFGLHCHLLRLRSTQAVISDDESLRLPRCEWLAAAEELADITHRDLDEDDADPAPYIFDSDAAALRAFVREMVTQSVVPAMERAATTWNEQVASRRRGLSGRFMSLSKRFTGFGVGSRASTGSTAATNNGSNYDALQGIYRADAPEAIMRKLADYAMMLRDYKLAQGVYEILCADFKSDKAWRHYAGANEMAAVSTLLSLTPLTTKARVEVVDQYLETAYYSYVTRVQAPYNALRTLLLALELLKLRGRSALDDAARWANKVLEDRLVGPVGYVLVMERIANCFSERQGIAGLHSGERRRKAAFWNLLASEAWLRMEKSSQASKRLTEAVRLYGGTSVGPEFAGMKGFLQTLQESIDVNRGGKHHIDGEELLDAVQEETDILVETLQEPSEHLGGPPSPVIASHRKSLSASHPTAIGLVGQQPSFDPLGVLTSNPSATSLADPHASSAMTAPLSPVREKRNHRAEGFE